MPSQYINPLVKEIVEKFLDKEIYPKILDKDNLLGVLVYGSSLTGFSSKNSDIDLLVILREAEHTTRGVKFVDGQKIEYFIKPIERFLSEGVSFTKRNCPSHIALGENAFILYDQGGLIENLIKADNQYYNQNHEKPKENYQLKFVQIENRIASLKNIFDRAGEEFYMVYFNILEMIRSFHSQRSGEAEIPFVKAYRIYNDETYYDKFVSNKAKNAKPDGQFVALYNKCVILAKKDKMLKNLIELYEYEKRFVQIDPTDYEIDV